MGESLLLDKVKEIVIFAKPNECLVRRGSQNQDVDAYFGSKELPNILRALNANYKHELVGERLLTTPHHYAYLRSSFSIIAILSIPILFTYFKASFKPITPAILGVPASNLCG